MKHYLRVESASCLLRREKDEDKKKSGMFRRLGARSAPICGVQIDMIAVCFTILLFSGLNTSVSGAPGLAALSKLIQTS